MFCMLEAEIPWQRVQREIATRTFPQQLNVRVELMVTEVVLQCVKFCGQRCNKPFTNGVASDRIRPARPEYWQAVSHNCPY
jgi:hypothetical protein